MKIGIFDSGLGGLVVLRSMLGSKLRNYDFVFLGDTKNLPYGNRSQKQIYQFAVRAIGYLFEQDCFLVIVACNTVSSEALAKIQREWLPNSKYKDRKVLGVIRPTVESIGKSSIVGLIGTNRTVDSFAYKHEMSKLNPTLKLISKATPRLVSMIESGKHDAKILKKYLRDFKSVDCLILGCTHYGLIKSQIRKILTKKVRVIAQEELLPNKLKSYLIKHREIDRKLSKRGKVQLRVTKLNERYKKLAEEWFGKGTSLYEIDY